MLIIKSGVNNTVFWNSNFCNVITLLASTTLGNTKSLHNFLHYQELYNWNWSIWRFFIQIGDSSSRASHAFPIQTWISPSYPGRKCALPRPWHANKSIPCPTNKSINYKAGIEFLDIMLTYIRNPILLHHKWILCAILRSEYI